MRAMKRRRFLKVAAVGTGALAVAGTGLGVWLAGPSAPVAGFADLAAARAWLQRLATSTTAHSLTAWPLAQVLEHCAQSVEFSLRGFPQPKSAAFQHTAGTLAFHVFDRRGAMHHDLVEPIPGAPALVSTSVAEAITRLLAAFDAFEAHMGPLQPHFAYGALDKPQYTRAHLMHLAEHATQVMA